ncbi:MAG: pyridoxamine 5'-phosphate oxidase family protein [Vicinamibacteria bacterium]
MSPFRPVRSSVLVVAFFLAATAARTTRAQSAPTLSLSRERILSVARDIIKAARFSTLVTVGEKGQPQARIVDPVEPDSAFAVYFATNPKSRKVAQIRKDARVTLLYFDAPRAAYVTLVGSATEVKGPEKAAHRKADWNEFFAADRPNSYVLYKVVPIRAEVVSAKDGLSGDPTTWQPEIVEFK